jgi:iron-sulfur cluster assembly protein
MIEVTPKAAEKIRRAFEQEGVAGGLRVAVIGGGCSGLTYQLKFELQAAPADSVFEFGDVRVFVDPKSLLYLHGMTLDYEETLMRQGFVFRNPHAQKTCGCGSSFTA